MRSSCRSRVARVLAATVAIVLGVVVVGCGGDDDDEPAPTPNGGEEQVQEPGAEEPEEPDGEELTGAALGKRVFADEACGNCHSISSGAGAGHGSGPALGGLLNSRVELTEGGPVRADEAYIRRAIEDPDAEIVRGYSAGTMSAAIPPDSLSKQDVQALVAYIKTLK
jgi:cytochrome c oxidase subunit 2